MSPAIKHYFNPLHIYCRLRNIGLTKKWATAICRFYEKKIFNKYIVARE